MRARVHLQCLMPPPSHHQWQHQQHQLPQLHQLKHQLLLQEGNDKRQNQWLQQSRPQWSPTWSTVSAPMPPPPLQETLLLQRPLVMLLLLPHLQQILHLLQGPVDVVDLADNLSDA